MSSSDTDPVKEAKRHRAPIWGMALAVLVGLLLAVAMVLSAVDGEENTDDAAIRSADEIQN